MQSSSTLVSHIVEKHVELSIQRFVAWESTLPYSLDQISTGMFNNELFIIDEETHLFINERFRECLKKLNRVNVLIQYLYL